MWHYVYCLNLSVYINVYVITFNTSHTWHCVLYSDGMDYSCISTAATRRLRSTQVNHWLISCDKTTHPSTRLYHAALSSWKKERQVFKSSCIYSSAWQHSHLWLRRGPHTQRPEHPGPSVGFSIYDNECRGKTVASFSGIHNVEKVNLISHGEKKNAGENWKKKLKVLVPTMRLLADVTFRYVCSHLGAAERNLLAGRASWGLSVSLEVTPEKTLLSEG